MHPASAFQNPHGFTAQGQTLLNSTSFSIVTGQVPADPTKYTVKDQSGSPLLWVMDSVLPHGQPNAGRSFAVRDAGQFEVMKLWYTPGGQGTTLLDTAGNVIGSVLISSKSVKEHKKGKDKEKDKNGKRQIVLQNSMNQPMLTMSGKGKHSSGNVEMKIKSSNTATKLGIPGMHSTDQKNKDKKDKDKQHKDKDKKDKDKDKDKKNKEVAEVTGNVGMGFQVRITQSNLNLQERNNIVGLLISYMELEKQGTSMSHYPPGTGTIPQPYYQQPGMNPGMPPSQVYPGQQFPSGQPIGMGNIPGASGQMGFIGGAGPGSGQTFQGQYPPPAGTGQTFQGQYPPQSGQTFQGQYPPHSGHPPAHH